MRVEEKNNKVAFGMPLITQGELQLTDARWLHQKLEVSTQFSVWIERRIAEYGFKANFDFYSNLDKSNFFGRSRKNYHLTLDMAKELAMLERNEVGRAMRRYFIEVEKKARITAPALQAPTAIFKAMESQQINGRALYPYREVLTACGYKPNNNGGRAQRYPQHFVKFGRVLYVTQEFAQHLYHQKAVANNRVVMRNSQPVLPADFGQQDLFLKGGKNG